MACAPRHIVLCADYNGHKNVLFQMEETDFRFGKGYAPQSRVVRRFKRDASTILVDAEGAEYMLFPDWSLRRLDGAA